MNERKSSNTEKVSYLSSFCAFARQSHYREKRHDHYRVYDFTTMSYPSKLFYTVNQLKYHKQL